MMNEDGTNINRNSKGFSNSIEFSNGLFGGLVSPHLIEPIGNLKKARPEVTELIEKQRSRINS